MREGRLDTEAESLRAPNGSVLGAITNVTTSAGEYSFKVRGWACAVGNPNSIDVHLYVGGPAASGVFVKAARADRPSAPALRSSCKTSSRAYGFELALTARESEFLLGQRVFVHGISGTDAPNALLTSSGRETLGDARQNTATMFADFGKPTPLAASAAGHLEGWSATLPADADFPTRSGFTVARNFGGTPAFEANVERGLRLGYTMVIRLDDFVYKSVFVPNGGYPYSHPNEWADYVQSRINRFGNSVIFDVWNEPNLAMFWGTGTQQDYFKAYQGVHAQLEAKFGRGNFGLTGPSTHVWNEAYLTAFLDFCAEKNLTVPYLNWHELLHLDFASITEHLKTARAIVARPKYAKLGVKAIGIYETFYTEAAGDNLATFAALEAGNADGGAANSCWNGDCSVQSFSGLLTLGDRKKRSSWFVWDEYGRGQGSRVRSSTGDAKLPILGSRGTGPAATVLLGSAYSGRKSARIELRNVGALPFLAQSKRVRIRVSSVENSGNAAASDGFAHRLELSAPIVDGAVVLPSVQLRGQEVYRLEIRAL